MKNRLILIAAMSAAAAFSVISVTGCAVAREQQGVGGYFDDSMITGEVKAKFAGDKTVSMMSISVETLKGEVQLAGFAKTDEEKAMAESLARSAKGVVAVKNDIVVR